jgi:hypothetical protein
MGEYRDPANPSQSAITALCLANYLLLPLDTQVFKWIVQCDWISLTTYIITEQLSVLFCRRMASLNIRNFTAQTMAFAMINIFLQGSKEYFLVAALEKGLLLSVLLDAATNVGFLDIACSISHPSYPSFPWIESVALLVIMGTQYYIGSMNSSTGPLIAILSSSATGEQMRLLASFLALRFVAGAPFQSVVVGISDEWELRVGVEKTKAGSSFEMGTTNLESEKGGQGAQKPMKFITNLTLSLIIATAFGIAAVFGFVVLWVIGNRLIGMVA